MEKKTINLTKVKVQQVDGKEAEVDYSKDIASLTYNRTQDLETSIACQKMFLEGECPYSDKVKEEFVKTINTLSRIGIDGKPEPVGIIYKKALLDAIG